MFLVFDKGGIEPEPPCEKANVTRNPAAHQFLSKMFDVFRHYWLMQTDLLNSQAAYLIYFETGLFGFEGFRGLFPIISLVK